MQILINEKEFTRENWREEGTIDRKNYAIKITEERPSGLGKKV